MRFSSFLMGGIVGAAAVMYLNRNGSGMTMFSQAGDSVGNMMNKAKTSFSGLSSQQNTSSKYGQQEAKTEDKVKEIINEDPQIKKEFNQIKAENTDKTMYQTQ